MPDSFLRKVAAHYGTEKPVVIEPANGHRPEPDHPLVRAALEKRLVELAAMAPESGRNNALNVAAAYLGRFPIDRGDLRSMLLDACQANGLLEDTGQHSCEATIRSGFRKADADGPRVIEERVRGTPPQPAPNTQTTNGQNPEPATYTDGAHLLDMVHAFLGRFINYPNDYTHVAHTLWIAHTWFMDHWESTPRIAFLSPEPASGKSRALEVTEPLVPRAVHSVNVTPAYLFRKVADPEGRPTILYDEIDTVFGPKAKDNEEIRGLLNSGHRKGAMAGRCVVKGKKIETEEIPSYCAVALAGLHSLPDTILTRSVVVHMRRRADGDHIEPWRMSVNGLEAAPLGAALEQWSVAACSGLGENVAGMPLLPQGIEDRDADVWEALVGVADMAGGDWPSKARVAAVATVAAFRDEEPSLGVQLLWDIHSIFSVSDLYASPDDSPGVLAANVAARTADLVSNLKGIEESPWANYGRDRKGLDEMRLAKMLRNYGIKSQNTRFGTSVAKAFHAWQFEDAWKRYGVGPSRPLSGQKPATPATPATPDIPEAIDINDAHWR